MSDSAGYPALWIRIQHRFGPRQTEWLMAAITLGWGAVLLLPIESMSTDAWAVMRSILPEFWWGMVFFLLGMARLIGLIINGSRKKITPWIRVVSAGIGFLLWVGISTGFALSGVISTWLATYPLYAVAEIANIIRAGNDVGENINGRAIKRF